MTTRPVNDEQMQRNRAFVERVKTANAIVDVALALGAIDHQGVRGSDYRGPCWIHGSSATSDAMSITGDKGLYHCFSCAAGGDVINLVCSKLSRGDPSADFKAAVEYLATRAGLAVPWNFEVGAKELGQDWSDNQSAVRVLGLAVDFYHLNLRDHDRRYLTKRGVTEATISELKIGTADGDGRLTRHLLDNGVSPPEILSSGLFYGPNDMKEGFKYGPKDLNSEAFKGRIVFPYWVHGKVRYLIARETARTPEKQRLAGQKYRKLLGRSSDRPYVASGIINNVLFNQDAATGAKKVVITEGVLDCISLRQAGVSAISPAGVVMSKAALEQIGKVLKRDQIIYVANDNEINNAGSNGARGTATALVALGLTVRMVQIPLTEKHENARKFFKK